VAKAKDKDKIFEARCILLGGDESVLRSDALKRILAHFTVAGENLEYEEFKADAVPPIEWVARAGVYPFLCERRIVVVRNLLRVDPTDEWDEKPKSKDHPFVKELVALPPTALLVLVADDEQGDDDKQRRLEGVARRWTDMALTANAYIEAPSTDRKEVMETLRKTAKERGKHMTPVTATLLTEMVSGSLSLALAELEKLVLYVGKNEAITDSDVKTVVAPETEYNVYQLIDAVVAGDSGAALKQLRILIGSQSKIEGQTFSRIMPTLSRQFRVIWQARLCVEDDSRSGSPSPRVLEMLPSKPRITDEKDWAQQRAMRAARRLSLPQIRRVFAELAHADASLKGMGASFSTQETLEEMVLRMASVCRSN